MADNRPAVAALRVSRSYPTPMRDVWNDALRDSILSRSLSRRIQMESTHLHSALRGYFLRCVCTCGAGVARTASADLFFERPLKKILACLSRICACTKLGLFAAALAQFLRCSACVPACGRKCRKPEARATFHLWLIWTHANPGHWRRRVYRLASC